MAASRRWARVIRTLAPALNGCDVSPNAILTERPSNAGIVAAGGGFSICAAKMGAAS